MLYPRLLPDLPVSTTPREVFNQTAIIAQKTTVPQSSITVCHTSPQQYLCIYQHNDCQQESIHTLPQQYLPVSQHNVCQQESIHTLPQQYLPISQHNDCQQESIHTLPQEYLPISQHNDDGADNDTATSNAHPDDDANLLVAATDQSSPFCNTTRLSAKKVDAESDQLL